MTSGLPDQKEKSRGVRRNKARGTEPSEKKRGGETRGNLATHVSFVLLPAHPAIARSHAVAHSNRAPTSKVPTIVMMTSTNVNRPSPLVTIRNHSLNPVNIRTEAPQFHLLALTGFYSKRIRIHPLIRRDFGRPMGVYEDIEHGWLVNNW